MHRTAVGVASLHMIILAGACQPTVIHVAGSSSDAGPTTVASIDGGTQAQLPDADFAASWPDGGGDVAPPPDRTCGQQTFKLERRPVELMLVLDRSGSMDLPASVGAATTKWMDVTSALSDTMMKTDATVEWGVKIFPSDDLTCHVTDGVDIASAPHNYANVWARIAATTPMGDGTPTTAAFQAAVAYLAAHPSSNARYLVLATDGEPNCMAGANRSGARDVAGAVAAVTAAAAAGLKTFVIGVATGADAEAALVSMATAGGETRNATPPYYPVASRADLVTALEQITGIVTDCVFPLDTPPPSPDDVAVKVGGSRVDRDASHASGWDYGASNGSVQLFGAACQQVKDGQDVQIVFGCPGIVIN